MSEYDDDDDIYRHDILYQINKDNLTNEGISPKELGVRRRSLKPIHVENIVKRIWGQHFVGKVLLTKQNLCYDNSACKCDLGLFSDPQELQIKLGVEYMNWGSNSQTPSTIPTLDLTTKTPNWNTAQHVKLGIMNRYARKYLQATGFQRRE